MLAPALEQVRDRISRYRGRSSSIGEQNTKAALIEPILPNSATTVATQRCRFDGES
jgi:hypothetical protein